MGAFTGRGPSVPAPAPCLPCSDRGSSTSKPYRRPPITTPPPSRTHRYWRPCASVFVTSSDITPGSNSRTSTTTARPSTLHSITPPTAPPPPLPPTSTRYL